MTKSGVNCYPDKRYGQVSARHIWKDIFCSIDNDNLWVLGMMDFLTFLSVFKFLISDHIIKHWEEFHFEEKNIGKPGGLSNMSSF